MISFATAMKWLNRIAQVFRPGYVRCSILPARAAEMSVSCPAFIMYRRPSGAALLALDSVALSGRVTDGASPGLKTWAVLLCHFMAKPIFS